ncbi:MAG: phosphoribosyltransferase [Parcubacteria group bacterium Gr01-1014_30]|nr:MAG: phosphoribosyltransferase [Parcubacteria group bacterium Gr01-1014_30]
MIEFLPRSHYKSKNLKLLISASPYNNFIVKKLIAQFKYNPFVKDLASTLAGLIIHQFEQTEYPPPLLAKSGGGQILIIPIPLTRKRLRQRGFNQAEEIGRELSKQLKVPLVNNVLLKTKETMPQVELSKQERIQNVKDVFFCENAEAIKKKTVLLVDDVFTTGSTMEEAARVLKESGAKEVWGITVARE